MKLEIKNTFNIFAFADNKCAVRLKKLIFLFALVAMGYGVTSFVSLSKADYHAPLKDTYKYYVKGKVLDEASGVEVANVNIKLEVKHNKLSSTVSDEKGDYELKFESANEYKGSEVEFILTRDGYYDKRVTNVPFITGEPLIVNFKMKRKPIQFKRDPNARRWETIEFLREYQRNN